MIKILHTADIHLGKEFALLREKGKEFRKQLLETFKNIMTLAKTEDVSIILIAGDLFDSNRLHGTVVKEVLSEFEKLKEKNIKVCILPGTHDAYTEDSIYRFVPFPSNVIIFTPEYNSHVFNDLNLAVYGKAFDGKLVGESPLKGLSLIEGVKFHIGMAHCSIKVEGLIERDTMILNKEEISASELDYIALGHWHSFKNYTQGGTKAYYCGSPEPIDMNQKGAGNVALVTIKGRKDVKVDPIRVGSKEFDELSIDLGPIKSIDDLIKEIKKKENPNLILKVTLEGNLELDCPLNLYKIEEELSDKFFCLRLFDKSLPKLDEVQLKNFPPNTVIGKFLQLSKEKIAEAKEEEKPLYEKALKLGFNLLQGRQDIIT